jgi:hypothetical protein
LYFVWTACVVPALAAAHFPQPGQAKVQTQRTFKTFAYGFVIVYRKVNELLNCGLINTIVNVPIERAVAGQPRRYIPAIQ